MKLERTPAGLMVSTKKHGVIGWVLKTTNDQFTYELWGKRTRPNLLRFETEDEALEAMMRE